MRKHNWRWASRTRGGELLREALEERDLTLRELGEKLGVHYVMLNHFAMGDKVPTLRNAIILNRELDIPYESWEEET